MSCRWKTIDDAINELILLGTQADAAERQFFEACVELERSELWAKARTPKDVDLSSFLIRCGIPGGKKYARYGAALKASDTAAVAERLGMPAVAVLNEIEAQDQRAKAIESALSASANKRREGMSPILSEESARQIATEVAGPKLRASKDDVLRAQIVALEKELIVARSKIAKLEKENAELRERVSAAAPGLAKTGQKSTCLHDKKEHSSQPNA